MPTRGAGRRYPRSYERLEFLGDRVLGLAAAHPLIEQFPDRRRKALLTRG